MSMNYNKLPRGEEEKYIKLIGQTPPQIIEDPLLNPHYEPPIQLLVREVVTKMQEQQEDKIMEVVHYYNINVNKEELIKALAYDRDQYMKGYTDALKQMEGYRKVEQGEWKMVKYPLTECSVCHKTRNCETEEGWNFCPNCGAYMKGAE